MKIPIIFFALFVILITVVLNYQNIKITNNTNHSLYNLKLVPAGQELKMIDELKPGESRRVLTNGKWYALSYSFRYSFLENGDTVIKTVDFWNLEKSVNLKWAGGNYIKIDIGDSVRIDSWLK